MIVDDIVEPLREQIVSVSQRITSSLELLGDDDFGTPKVSAVIQSCREEIASISEMANSMNLGGLQAAADALCERLQNADDNDEFSQNLATDLKTWMDNLIEYARDPGDASNCESLLFLLTKAGRNRSQRALAADALAIQDGKMRFGDASAGGAEVGRVFFDEELTRTEFRATEVIDEPDWAEVDDFDESALTANDSIEWPDGDLADFEELLEENDEFAESSAGETWSSTDNEDLNNSEHSEESGTNDILAVLSTELTEVSDDLSAYAEKFVASENADERADWLARYEELVNRLTMASNCLGLDGVEWICHFVNRNAAATISLDSTTRQASLPVLKGWPQQVANYLNEPGDDDICLAIVDYLEQSHWPDPLAYREVRELLRGLTKAVELSADYEVESRSATATEGDVALSISADVDQAVIDAFFVESPGSAEELASLIGKIADGQSVQKNTEAAQRISHTIKGSANLVGIVGVATLAHHLEDILEYLTDKHRSPPAALVDTMLETVDTMEVMMESLVGDSKPPENARQTLQELLDWANRIDRGQIDDDCGAEEKAVVAIESEISDDAPKEDSQQTDPVEIDATPKTVIGNTAAELLRISRETVENIFNLVGETSIGLSQIQELVRRLCERGDDFRRNEKVVQARRLELENVVSIRDMAAQHRHHRSLGQDAEFDSLEMDEYSEFYTATHSFIESVADDLEVARGIADELGNLEGLFRHQMRLNRDLQDMVMTTRMVVVDSIAARLQRTIRQVCRATGKKAELTIVGYEMMLDGEVLNKLADPLMHMLRNAVDHSIESEEDRLAAKKQGAGQVTLSFVQEGNTVVVTCADDGRGLDYERVRKLGIERGLIGENENPDNEVLSRLILRSGFSTRENVTQISGRGIGMDVVHETISGLKGAMEVGDNSPCGTKITLRLPITLLTSHCLLVGLGNERYALPTSTLQQILSPGTGKLSMLANDATYQLGQEVFPAFSLAEILGKGANDDWVSDERSSILLIQSDRGRVAVAVEEIHSSYDLVVKSLGHYIGDCTGVSGVALLGDGGVVPVLMIGDMVATDRSSPVQTVGKGFDGGAMELVHRPRVLIVDDSLSVRNSLSQLVSDSGFEPMLARDGLEAISVVQKESVDLVLTDLEMPRMNGVELTTQLRAQQAYSELPIIMLTSRTMRKHREQATRAGINEFVTKPFAEDDLITIISAHIGTQS